MSALRLGLVFALLAILTACQSTTPPVKPPPDRPLPEYAAVAATYNARTAPLERLWARVIVRFTVKDDKGRRRTEQGEGYLQIIRPMHVLLSVGSYLDRMYFYLGSNETHYWWIDALPDKPREAAVGELALATRDRAAELGVPVHPLDLLELIGVTTIPDTGGSLRWVDAGLELSVPARWGARRLTLNPTTLEPQHIDLIAESGELVASAEITAPVAVTIEGSGLRPTIAGRVVIQMPALEAEVIIDISSPETSSRRPRPQVFNLDTLLRAARVERIVSIDDAAAASQD